MKTLKTERLILRAWEKEDAEAMQAFYSDPEVMEKAGAQTARSLPLCQYIIRQYSRADEVWAVVEKASGTPVGSVFLEDIGRRPEYRELSYVLSADRHGRGYMTEAVRAVLAYGFRELGLEVIAAAHYPGNAPSRRVLKKCGFRYEGTLRGYSKNGQDSVRYSILRSEWER